MVAGVGVGWAKGARMSDGDASAGGRHEPESNPVVEALLRDGGVPPDCTVLTGFLGKAGTEGRWRLYSDAQLNGCIEFDAADLVYSTTAAVSGLPVSVVWIRRDAPVQEITYTTAESAFLQGAIVDDQLAGSAGDAFAEAQIIGTIIRTISRLFCRPSRRGPCTVRSLCNSCPVPT